MQIPISLFLPRCLTMYIHIIALKANSISFYLETNIWPKHS